MAKERACASTDLTGSGVAPSIARTTPEDATAGERIGTPREVTPAASTDTTRAATTTLTMPPSTRSRTFSGFACRCRRIAWPSAAPTEWPIASMKSTSSSTEKARHSGAGTSRPMKGIAK
jgi:hypothetical protein